MRAFESDPGGATAYGTSVGYPRLRAWIADRHGVEPERVLVTNGSMQADAFLFEQLVGPGDEVIVERPTYDRTLLSLRERGARLHAVELQPDGIDTDALARLLAGPRRRGRSSPTSSPTSRTRPATRCRRPSARRCWRWPPSTTSCVRGRPLRRAALQRRAAADDAVDGPRARGVCVVVLEDRLPGHPRRLPRRAAPS